MRDPHVSADERTEVLGVLNRALDDGVLPLADYDRRVVAVGVATYTSEVVAQLRDLPPRYAWLPALAVAPEPRTPTTGRAALILGILSVPAAFCLVGGVLGVVAVVLSVRGDRPAGLSAALIGRVFGIIGVVLSITAGVALYYAMTHSLGP